MTLFSWQKTGQQDIDRRYNTGIIGRRWALTLAWCALSIEHQIQHKDGWCSGGPYYQIGLHWDFRVKFVSAYYDGQHYALWLGPLCVTWMR